MTDSTDNALGPDWEKSLIWIIENTTQVRIRDLALDMLNHRADLAPDPQDARVTQLLQDRVAPWMDACFGPEISGDKLERGDRFLEEALELLQSGGYPPERVAALTDYVFSRDVGEPSQEVGGVMITLAAYCLAHGLDMHEAGETELARIWTKVDKIRAKQAAKPKGSALPIRADLAPDPRSPWQPIATAPKNGDWIWVYLPDAEPTTYRVRYCLKQGPFGVNEWQVNDFTYLTLWSKPTHWMPATEPDPRVKALVEALRLAHNRLIWASGIIANDTARDIAAMHVEEARAALAAFDTTVEKDK
jgi:hypothetical protein